MTSSEDLRLRERAINLAGRLYLSVRKRKPGDGKPRVTVLNYHKISGDSFRKHLRYIRRHYRVLSPGSFIDWLNDRIVIDEPSVLFTFDDGYMSFYEEIYPILKETETPVFMFIPTGFVGRNEYFWADKVEVAMKKSSVRAITVRSRRFYLLSRWYRSDFYTKVQQYLRVLNEESKHEICERIFERLNVTISEDDMAQYRFVDWREILEMDRSGLVLFGSHSVTHPNLATLPDDALKHELSQSKRTLENHLAKPVDAFAYPYGARGFWDERTISELETAGYSCAFTTIEGAVNGRRKDRLRLPRVLLFQYQNEGAAALKLNKYACPHYSTHNKGKSCW